MLDERTAMTPKIESFRSSHSFVFDAQLKLTVRGGWLRVMSTRVLRRW